MRLISEPLLPLIALVRVFKNKNCRFDTLNLAAGRRDTLSLSARLPPTNARPWWRSHLLKQRAGYRTAAHPAAGPAYMAALEFFVLIPNRTS